MTSCCHCCKSCPKTGYKLSQDKCGVCTLLGKSKCYFDRMHDSPPQLNRHFQKRFESTELSTKRPYESPQFSDSNNERRESLSRLGSLRNESLYVSPFELQTNQAVVIPVYYEVDLQIQPKNRTFSNNDDLTTFRPYTQQRKLTRKDRRQPLNPNQLMKTLNIRI